MSSQKLSEKVNEKTPIIIIKNTFPCVHEEGPVFHSESADAEIQKNNQKFQGQLRNNIHEEMKDNKKLIFSLIDTDFMHLLVSWAKKASGLSAEQETK